MVPEIQRSTVSDITRLARNAHNEEKEKAMEPYNYIARTPGAEMPLCVRLPKILNYWLKIPQDKLDIIEDIAGMIWNGSGILDDIQDNSITRYDVPAAHIIYGIGGVLNSAYYVIAIAIKRVLQLNHPEAVRIFSEQCMQITRGQGIEIYWKDNCICPTDTEFKVMALQKCGTFCLVARLMQLFSDFKEDITILIGMLMLFWQIRDDYYDLYADENGKGKASDDLTVGNFNFLIVHAIRTSPAGNEVMNIIKQKTKTIEMKQQCVNLLKKHGTYAYTRTVLEELDKKIRSEIERLNGNPMLEKILDEAHSKTAQL